MGDEKQYIFRIVSETQGIQKSIQDMKQLEAQATKTASNLQRTIIAPSGRSATEEIARRTPGFAQTAEQKRMLQGISSPKIIMPTGVIGGGARKEEFTGVAESLEKVEKSTSKARTGFQDLTEEFNRSRKHTKDLGKETKGLDMDLGKLALRAAVTIPIWLALRSAFMGVLTTITSGAKSIVDMDRELARIRTVTDDVTDMTGFLDELGTTARRMSTETGASVEDILHAFYGFKDAGLSTEVAMEGMKVSVKGSIALFGDLKETAKTLTDIYVLMGDKIEGARTPQERMERIMSSIAVLQKTNKFELNEYIEGLKSFAASAASSNLTLDQMTFMLAKTSNFMQRGSTGGTQLARAFKELSINAQKSGLLLGKAINLDNVDKFDLMLSMMEELNTRFTQGKDISQELFDIFGIRAEKSVAAFVVRFKDVVKEWKNFENLSPERRMEILNDQFNTATLTIERQVQRLQKIREQMGANFLAGIIGIDLTNTKDAAEGLKLINDRLNDMIPTLNAVGSAIRPLLLLLSTLVALREAKVFLNFLKKTPVTAGVVGGAILGGTILSKLEEERKASKKTSQSDQYKAYLASGGKMGPGLYRENLTFGNKKDIAGIELEPIKIIKKATEDTQKIIKETRNTEEDITGFYDYQSMMLERGKILGQDQLDIERRRLDLIIQSTDITEKDKTVHEQKLKIIQLENEEVIKYSQNIQTSLSSSLKDIMSGKGGNIFTAFNTAIVDNYRNTMSEGVSSIIMSTGIGEMFGGAMSKLKGQLGGVRGMIEAAHETVYGQIVRGHRDGLSGTKAILPGVSGTASSSTIAGALSTTGGFWAGYTGAGYQPVAGNNRNVWVPASNYGQRGYKQSSLGSYQRGQMALGGAQSALTGYSAYQSASQGGLGVGGSIASGLLAAGGSFAGVMSGIAMASGTAATATSAATTGTASVLGLSMGPVGWAMMGVGLMIAAMIPSLLGGEEKTSTETKTTENKISSRIDVTNKNLEIINRNLIGLRTDIRTYILPSSAYFSSKTSLDEEFSIASRMASIE